MAVIGYTRFLALLVMVLIGGRAFAFDAGWLPSAAFYTVPELLVEKEAETGVAAKDAAVEHAVRVGLKRVLERLVPRKDAARIATTAKVDARDLVTRLAITDESAQAHHYRARISVAFSRERVIRLIRRHGARYTESQSPPMVVIPLVLRDGAVDWENTRWRKVWSRHTDRHGIVPISVFSGSAEDRSYLRGDPFKVSQTSLGLMALRYMAEYTAIVAIDAEALGGDADISLRGSIGGELDEGYAVQISGFDAHGPFRYVRTLDKPALDEVSDRNGDPLAPVVHEIVAELEDRWKAAALGRRHVSTGFEPVQDAKRTDGIKATVAPRDRVSIEAALQTMPGIVDFSLGAGGFGDVAHIQFDGDLELLRASLVRRGVIMIETDAGYQLAAF